MGARKKDAFHVAYPHQHGGNLFHKAVLHHDIIIVKTHYHSVLTLSYTLSLSTTVWLSLIITLHCHGNRPSCWTNTQICYLLRSTSSRPSVPPIPSFKVGTSVASVYSPTASELHNQNTILINCGRGLPKPCLASAARVELKQEHIPE